MKHILGNISVLLSGAMVLGTALSCQQEIDNEYSRHKFSIQMTASSENIVLDESKPDETVLTISWTPAADYGDDYTTTYLYSIGHTTSTASAVKEYEDDGNFTRSYTNKELQTLLTGRFGQLTSTKSSLKFSINASFEGPRLIIPDESSVIVTVKTYGAKQFAADKVWLGGSVVSENVELTASSGNPDVYVWQGNLKAGQLNFPVVYGDENNLIVPEVAGQTVSGTDAMAAKIVDAKDGGGWNVTAADAYRVTLNFATKTVTVVPVSSIVEIDKIYLAGTSVSSDDVEFTKCLEREEGLYAFRGELKAGTLYMPIEFEGTRSVAIVPKEGTSVSDGEDVVFTQVSASGAATKAWNIPADGTYRIVIDIEAKTVTIYSSATDLGNVSVSYNNTVDGINPYTQEVTQLWMFGGAIGWDHDSDLKTGFQRKYILNQSLADPAVFVYCGDDIPRKSQVDDNNKTGDYKGQSITGFMKFLVSSIENNVWSYGSTASAKRNSYSGYVECALGQYYDSVGGQSDNRYAYFIVPEGANCVVVKIDRTDVKKATVKFEKR